MPQAGTCKRPAPGSSPVPQTSPRNITIYNTQASQIPVDQFLQWNSTKQYPEDSSLNLDPSDGFSNPPYDDTAPPNMQSNQIARRAGGNSQVVARQNTGVGGDVWSGGVLSQQQQQQQQNGQVPWQDDDEQLDQKAAEAKKAAQSSRKSIPPFVQKLSSFLDESRNTELIRWSPKGDSFVVLDEDEFARTLIPELFKHNNYASFVRQLNMYGFHKRVGLSDNSMRASERKNKSPSEYFNPYFKRGRPNLLWLIQKPKPATSGGKKSRSSKSKDDDADDDGEETYEADNVAAMGQAHEDIGAGLRSQRQPLLIGPGDSGLAKEELSQVHQELQAIRQQQAAISGVITKIRREHETLYGQAAAFQELHSRHETSINAILTFLATVYNRSLEGHGNQDIGNLFAGAIPHNIQQQGSVVDVGDFASPDAEPHPGLTRRSSRKPLLLQAPPSGTSNGTPSPNVRQTSITPSPQQKTQARSSAQPGTYRQQNHQNPGVVEEIYEPEPLAATNQSRPYSNGLSATSGTPEGDFMSFINSANARDLTGAASRMDFPQALSHLQNADGKSPLSPTERNSVLQLMASNNPHANGNGGNNALTSPDPPDIPTPNLENWNATAQDLQYLEKTLREQNEKVESLSNMLQPLSPSGSIPGLNKADYTPGPDSGLDFNQIFNDDYFNNADDSNLDFGAPAAGDFANEDDFAFDNPPGVGLGDAFGSNDAEETGPGRVVETVDSSEATSPANTVEEGAALEDIGSPRKRRRRN